MDVNTFIQNKEIIGGYMIISTIFMIIIYVLSIIGRWKTYQKLDITQWKSIIPFYNDYIWFKEFMPSSVVYFIYLFLQLLSWFYISSFNLGLDLFGIVTMAICIILSKAMQIICIYRTNEFFGASIGMTFIGVIFNFAWWLLLGFNPKYKYKITEEYIRMKKILEENRKNIQEKYKNDDIVHVVKK